MKSVIPYVISALFLAACSGSEPASQTSSSEPVAAEPAAVELTTLQKGQKAFAKCRACHTLDEGGRNMVGPNLWGIYGSQSAAKEGFAYSKAMKASEIIWNDETMDGFLQKPAKYMPGNRMVFIGIKKQEERDALQAFLKSKTSPEN